jgi:hypothetical protein
VASLYLLFFCPEQLLRAFPGTDGLAGALAAPWGWLVPRVGEHLLGLSGPLEHAGGPGGDHLGGYVAVLCCASVALLGAAVWSALDRRRRTHARAHAWVRVMARYTLAGVMLQYGLVKVFKSQFPHPGPLALMEPLGEASPMGLLWTFMGYSLPYNVFTGGVEVLGGLLLYWRRTTALGALVVAGAMANVVMLNLSYDVPVKVYSAHLLLLALFLLAPEARRLADFFLLGRTASLAPLHAPPLARGWARAHLAAKALFLGAVLVPGVLQAHQAMHAWGDLAPQHPLAGAYQVTGLERDGRDVPLLATDGALWQRLAIRGMRTSPEGPTQLFVRVTRMDGTMRHLTALEDAGTRTLALTDRDTREHLSLRHAAPEPGHLVLEGTVDGHALRLRLRQRPLDSFPLLTRGFRWVSPAPFNR